MSQAKATPKARRTKPDIKTETPSDIAPAVEQKSPRRSTLRTVLFVLGPLVALAIAAGIYFAGGRYVTEENAYVGAKTISVPAQVSGQIAHVNVTQNQPVKAQATLIEIDPESYRISVDAARSQLGMTRDELSAQLLTYRAQKQQADQAQANLIYAHQQLQRSEQLVTRGIAAQASLDAARRDEQSAAAALASARTVAQSTLAQLGGSGDLPVEQQPKFLAAKANLETAERNLRLTEVKAPWDGVVTNVDAAAVGSFVTAGQQAMSMVSDTDVWVDANIRETDLTYVSPGNPVELSVDAYPRVVFKGHVQTINPASGAVFALLPPQNAVLALYMFLVHVFTSDNAFLDMRMFGDRNFVVGQVLIFAIGAILLATLALLTPFLERLMNFPVLQAGLVLAPRGFGTMASMLLVGQLLGRTGPRLPIIAGLLLTAFALHEMAGFTPEVSQGAIIRTGIVQGFGLGLVFVPLSTATFATLAPRFRTQGTALYSLMRNLGSSVGISVTTMLLTRYTTIMHSNLVEHVNPFSLAVRNYADLLELATLAGRAQLDQEVIVQGSAIAYSNNFRLMAYAALAVIPLVLLLRGETRKAATEIQAVAARQP